MTGPSTLHRPLDMSIFPTTYEYTGATGTTTELADLIPVIKDTLELWVRLGVIRNTIESFGFAVSFLEPEELEKRYDDPELFVGFTGGWGPEQACYTANAIRKMRAAARTGSDTLEMVEVGAKHGLELFEHKVESQIDGAFPWGEFPWGGAAFISFGDRTMLIATSFVTQDQDDFVSGFLGKLFGKALYLTDVVSK